MEVARESAAFWAPLFDDLSSLLPPGCAHRIALYSMSGLDGEFGLEASQLGTPADWCETELVALVGGLFTGSHAAEPFILTVTAEDLLTAKIIEASATPHVKLFLPFHRADSGRVQVVAVLSLFTELANVEPLATRLSERLNRYAGVFEATIDWKRKTEERDLEATWSERSETRAILEALVPDAFAERLPLFPGALILEGRPEMGNRVIIDDAWASISPYFLQTIALQESSWWALGRPTSLFGLGTISEPRWPAGRICNGGALAIFAWDHQCQPAGDDEQSSFLTELAAEWLAVAKARREGPVAELREEGCRRRFAGEILGALVSRHASRTPELSSFVTQFQQLEQRFTLLCIGERRHIAQIAEWHNGPAFVAGFEITKGGKRGSLQDVSESDPSLGPIVHELSHQHRALAWASVFASLVEDSHGDRQDCEFHFVGGRLSPSDTASKTASFALHGRLLSEGDTIRLTWHDDLCALELASTNHVLRSQWRVRESYRPLAMAALPTKTIHVSLGGENLSYLPPTTQVTLRRNASATDSEWVVSEHGWSRNHVRTLARTIRSGAELLSTGIGTFVGLPLSFPGSLAGLDCADWCRGSGRRRFLLAAVNRCYSSDTELTRGAVSTLRRLQFLVASRVQADVSELDRVLIGHIRHDLSTLRSGFDTLVREILRDQSGLLDHERASMLDDTIKALDGVLGGFDMLRGLYEHIGDSNAVDLTTLESQVELAIRYGAVRACKKLGLPTSDDARLRRLVGYQPPPPTSLQQVTHPVALLLLENVIGNAIYAAVTFDRSNEKPIDEAPAVEIARLDNSLIIRNRCRPDEWNRARTELHSKAPRTLGLTIITEAARMTGIALVSGAAANGAAEIQLIPSERPR